MADTTKTYENIFIKKNAAGDREYIKVPYAILADPPTIPDVSGFMPKSGGTFTGDVTFNKKINLGQGDANCLYLGSDGRLNGPENRTLFGLVSGATTFGHQAYSLHFRGSAARPQYTTDGSNYKDLALKSDIPSVPTNYVTTDSQQEISALKTFTSAQGVGSCQGAFRVFVSKEEMDNYYAKFATGDATSTNITFTSMTNKAFLARTNNTNRTAYKDAGIDVWKPSGKYSFLFPEKSGTLAITSDIPDISGKQDKLTAGSNISISGNTISATVPTDVVKYTAQTLTTAQKTQARSNIGAGTSSFSGSYNDLTNKPTIPTVNNGTLTIQKNGTTVATFSANQSGNATANITVPTFSLSGTTLTITV